MSQKKPSRPNSDTPLLPATVVAAYGKRYLAKLRTAQDDTDLISCVTRGKKTHLACGDHVEIALTDTTEGIVETLQKRSTLLYRSNAFKSKILAANVTQMIIVLATQPSFYEALLNRCLIAAEAANIQPLIVLNKCDLEDKNHASAALNFYAQLGYQTLQIAAVHGTETLRPYLQAHSSILVGQSGMGKSTIINALLPDENVRTQDVSNVLDSGKHTTTAAHLYSLDADSHIIDSPGLQEFGLYHLSIEALEHAFIEFRPYLGHCRFNNCSHHHEPDCAIKQAVSEGKLSESRLSMFQTLYDERQQAAPYQ